MLDKIKGIVHSTDDPLSIECGNFFFEVMVSRSTRNALPKSGEPITLFTQLVVKENEWQLFGFHTAEERVLYRLLIKVNGVGAKMALAILSGYEVSSLASHIESKNIQALSAISGVGKKTAERIGLELHGKLFSLASEQNESSETVNDAITALIGLGIKSSEAKRRIKSIPAYQQMELEDLIKFGLSKKDSA